MSGTSTKLRQGHFRHKAAPTAERGNILGAADVGGFHDKALDAATVLQTHRADRQWWRDRVDEFGEGCRRQRPELDLD